MIVNFLNMEYLGIFWDVLIIVATISLLWSRNNIIILLNFLSILMLLSFRLLMSGVIEFTIVIIMVYQSAIIILFLVNSLHLVNLYWFVFFIFLTKQYFLCVLFALRFYWSVLIIMIYLYLLTVVGMYPNPLAHIIDIDAVRFERDTRGGGPVELYQIGLSTPSGTLIEEFRYRNYEEFEIKILEYMRLGYIHQRTPIRYFPAGSGFGFCITSLWSVDKLSNDKSSNVNWKLIGAVIGAGAVVIGGLIWGQVLPLPVFN